MCECYQIGGKFIAEDPDCSEHGKNFQSSFQNLKIFDCCEIESKFINLLKIAVIIWIASSKVLPGTVNPLS